MSRSKRTEEGMERFLIKADQRKRRDSRLDLGLENRNNLKEYH